MGLRIPLCSLVVLLACFVVPAPADVTCYDYADNSWTCPYACCSDDIPGCCVNIGAVYWYAWLLVSMFVMILLCACLACAGYGYRRHYVVRRVVYAPPTTTTVISAAAPAYQSYTPATDQYQPYKPAKYPPPYYPPSAPPNYGTS